MSRGESLDWAALISRFVHPTKVLIIEAMRWIDQPLSPNELHKVLDRQMSLSALSYHVTSLAKANALRRVLKRKVRGIWESHYYFSKAIAPHTSKH